MNNPKKYHDDIDIDYDSDDREIIDKRYRDMLGEHLEIDARSFTADRNYM